MQRWPQLDKLWMPYQYSASSCLFIILILAWTGCSFSGNNSQPIDISGAVYVGADKCVTCHRAEAEKYAGSHHDRAMQIATEATVLGNFKDASIEHHGIVSRFFRKGDKYYVNTEGPDGTLQDFEIKYVFGIEPLQQYMVEFPSASDGDSHSSATTAPVTPAGNAVDLPRVQVLRLCWDTQQSKWFYLPPPDVPEKLDPSDDLHWTGVAQRWNTMCAECHSTDYQKNFRTSSPQLQSATNGNEKNPVAQPGGVYHSTFIEINVSCEACHGPGSVHMQLAEQWFPGWNRERGYGLANLKATAENQIQACAPCHSRRSVVAAGFKAGDNYYDFYTNQLLTENIYYPDGQILDEDYVHGSFIQSKMYHKGIRCSDCHDPHSARLKHDGNAVCTSCHQHPAAKYDSVAHHFHPPADGLPAEKNGTLCVNCHMPATTYMAVDARRDHSLRIPRPDISQVAGTPNACTGCHLKPENIAAEKARRLPLYQDWMLAAREGDAEVQAEIDRANEWCDAACDKWYGAQRRRDPHFGLAIAAAQSEQPDGAAALIEVLRKRGHEAPAIARATALQLLLEIDPEAAGREALRLITDEHPLVRSSATTAILGNPSQSQSVSLLETALTDPVRSVRTEAARNLLNFPEQLRSDEARTAFNKAYDELVASILTSNDRAGAHLTLGILAEQLGRTNQAVKAYETAIAVEPQVAGPRTNLASLTERIQADVQQPEVRQRMQAEVQRLRKEELALLLRDVALLPSSPDLQYRTGMALYLDGQKELAVEHLVIAAELEPKQVGFAQAAAMLYESLEQWPAAIRWAEEALQRSGGAVESQSLLDRIRASSK
ncbi:MAG: HEAT repeat domain-containing protein [Pirellulaceae bacterium]